MATDSEPHDSELYPVIYQATHDALWNVVGTIVYALFLVVVFFIGLQVVLLAGLGTGPSFSAVLVSLFGLALGVLSAVRFLQLFDLLPSLR